MQIHAIRLELQLYSLPCSTLQCRRTELVCNHVATLTDIIVTGIHAILVMGLFGLREKEREALRAEFVAELVIVFFRSKRRVQIE